MFCNQCGKEMPDNGKFCPECGSAASGVSTDSGVEQSLGEFKTLVHANQPPEAGAGGLTVSMLSERYELGEEIGRGGFAAVFRATDKKLNRAVAIKKLHPEKADATTMARFRREALAIASLNHRNIVQVYDVGEDPSDGSLFLVMELIEGGSLREHLKKQDGQRFPLAEATALLRGIGQGLSHAHRKNLVHRDIKPANILLQKEGNEWVPKIVDFGLAQAGRDSELSMSGYGMGTAYYMPPEQRRDAKSVNHTADIYALGKVFYEMVTGELPDTLDPAEIPPPKALAEIIFKCVKPKPEDRFFSVDELLAELEKIQTTKPPKIGNQKSAIGNENECPACGVANGKEIKFCVGCGGGLFIDCPECDKENSIAEKFCGSCGTEVEGFLAVQEVANQINRYAAEKKWSRVLKESEGFKAEARLPGKKGKEMRSAIGQSAEQAKETLKEIERLEELVDAASRRIQEEAKTLVDPSGVKKGSTRSASANAAGSRVYDQTLLRHLAALAKLKDLTAEQQHIERAVKACLAEAKKQAALAQKRKVKKIALGLAVFVALGFGVDQSILAARKGSFKTAVEHKQLEKALAMAGKLGDRFNTVGDLDALKNCLTEKETLERLLAGQRELLAKYGGKEWESAGEKIRLAEKPASPVASAAAYREAIPLVQQVQAQMADMLKAESAFSAAWKTSADALKRFEPGTYKKLNDGVEQVKALVDPVAAKTGWKKLASDVATAQQKIAKLDAAKANYEAAVEKIGRPLLEKHGKDGWGNAKQAVAQAEKFTDLAGAIALWEKAETLVNAAWTAMQQRRSTIKVASNAGNFKVLQNGRQILTGAGSVSLLPFVAHTLEVQAKGFKSVQFNLQFDEPGMDYGTKRITLEKVNGPAERERWAADLGSGVTMDFMPIAAGSFQMGSNNGDSDEKPVHRVSLSKPFWMAKTEVTQAQYQKIMGANPSHFKGSENPVETVSWPDAVAFCKKLTERERQSGRLPAGFEYVLPTEAQWEYACRAGTTGDYAGSLDAMGWYSSNSGSKTHAVGTKQANAWGLHDMHGNVWEWCLDDWHGSYAGAPADGSRWGEGSGSYRVFRGGSWFNSASNCRSALRYYFDPSIAYNNLGFRPLVMQK